MLEMIEFLKDKLIIIVINSLDVIVKVLFFDVLKVIFIGGYFECEI